MLINNKNNCSKLTNIIFFKKMVFFDMIKSKNLGNKFN